jgi:hypothetical protein
MVVEMKNLIVAVVVCALIGSEAMAGPFGLVRRSGRNAQATTTGGQVYQQPRYPVANAFLGTAQGVANYLASLGRIGHFGGNPYSYEGVGMGGTPDQALRNCCNNGGVVADYGVCQGANGMWYACKRYHGR